MSEEDKEFYNKTAAQNGRSLSQDQLEHVAALNVALDYDIPNAHPKDVNKLLVMVYEYFKIMGYNEKEALWIKTNAPDIWERLEGSEDNADQN